jgi:two-component system, NtrC family, response regulator
MDNRGKLILLVEDEPRLRTLLAKILSLEGNKVIEAGDVATAQDILKNENVYVVVTDVKLPDMNGIEFTRKIKGEMPMLEVIVLTAYGNIKDGVKAMKLGAFDYLTKGDGDEKLPLIVSKALDKASLNRQVQEMEFRLESKSSFAKIIGKSAAVQHMMEMAQKVAVTDTTVLLQGETGTGKELIAEAIHLASRRRKGPFIVINCAAIPKDLQESELFGHKRGSFTGAASDKKGYLEVADRGTIMLDELGEMSPDLQAKLLRALENKVIHRVGDTSPIPIDIRIIAATNRNLNVDNSEFRKDLYYRLSTFAIHLPSLRERSDDVQMLAIHFLKESCEKTGKKVEAISPEVLKMLRTYSWPGNIRELKNVIERAVILADQTEITPGLLPAEFNGQRESATPAYTPTETQITELPNSDAVNLKTVEQQHILRVLKMVNGNKSEAAKRLDIGLATLYRKLKEYNMD